MYSHQQIRASFFFFPFLFIFSQHLVEPVLTVEKQWYQHSCFVSNFNVNCFTESPFSSFWGSLYHIMARLFLFDSSVFSFDSFKKKFATLMNEIHRFLWYSVWSIMILSNRRTKTQLYLTVTGLQCIIQWFLINPWNCASITTFSLRTFLSPHETPIFSP